MHPGHHGSLCCHPGAGQDRLLSRCDGGTMDPGLRRDDSLSKHHKNHADGRYQIEPDHPDQALQITLDLREVLIQGDDSAP
jgi:hypothetical protein